MNVQDLLLCAACTFGTPIGLAALGCLLRIDKR